MSERGGQHADRGTPIKVRHFLEAAARLQSGAATAAALDQQPGDERCLDHDRQRANAELPLIFLPQILRARVDLAPARKTVHADLPALELSPVEYRRGELVAGERNIRGALAAHDAQDPFGRIDADQLGTDDDAADGAVADL